VGLGATQTYGDPERAGKQGTFASLIKITRDTSTRRSGVGLKRGREKKSGRGSLTTEEQRYRGRGGGETPTELERAEVRTKSRPSKWEMKRGGWKA